MNWTPFVVGPEFVSCVKDFIREHEARLPGSGALLDAIGLRLAHLVIRGLLGVDSQAGKSAGRFEVVQAVEHMQEHFAERLSVSHLARVLGAEGFFPMMAVYRLRGAKATV